MTPAATLHVAERWCDLLARGVHASPEGLLSHLMGPGAVRLQALQAGSGALVWPSVDRTRLLVAGDAAAVSRALLALDALVTPAATIEVEATWGPLIAAGVHATAADCVARLFGAGGARLRGVEQATEAVVWATARGAHVHLAGTPAAVAHARAEIDKIVVPGAVIDVSRELGGLVGDGDHASLSATVRALIGVRGERLEAVERSSGAVAWVARDRTRLFLSGDAPAIARARAALVAGALFDQSA